MNGTICVIVAFYTSLSGIVTNRLVRRSTMIISETLNTFFSGNRTSRFASVNGSGTVVIVGTLNTLVGEGITSVITQSGTIRIIYTLYAHMIGNKASRGLSVRAIEIVKTLNTFMDVGITCSAVGVIVAVGVEDTLYTGSRTRITGRGSTRTVSIFKTTWDFTEAYGSIAPDFIFEVRTFIIGCTFCSAHGRSSREIAIRTGSGAIIVFKTTRFLASTSSAHRRNSKPLTLGILCTSYGTSGRIHGLITHRKAWIVAIFIFKTVRDHALTNIGSTGCGKFTNVSRSESGTVVITNAQSSTNGRINR